MGESLGAGNGVGGSTIHVKRRGLLASTAKCYYGVPAPSRPGILIQYFFFCIPASIHETTEHLLRFFHVLSYPINY